MIRKWFFMGGLAVAAMAQLPARAEEDFTAEEAIGDSEGADDAVEEAPPIVKKKAVIDESVDAPKPAFESGGPGSAVDSKSGAEGTRALNRFHTEAVKRSAYQLNGEPLEVDPD